MGLGACEPTLQKSMDLIPLEPRAGPTGGLGLAWPAPTMSLTICSTPPFAPPLDILATRLQGPSGKVELCGEKERRFGASAVACYTFEICRVLSFATAAATAAATATGGTLPYCWAPEKIGCRAGNRYRHGSRQPLFCKELQPHITWGGFTLLLSPLISAVILWLIPKSESRGSTKYLRSWADSHSVACRLYCRKGAFPSGCKLQGNFAKAEPRVPK